MRFKYNNYLNNLPSSLKLSNKDSNFAKVINGLDFKDNIKYIIETKKDKTNYNIRFEIPTQLAFIEEISECNYPHIEEEEISYSPFNSCYRYSTIGCLSGVFILATTLSDPQDYCQFDFDYYSLNFSGLNSVEGDYDYFNDNFTVSGDLTLVKTNEYYKSFDSEGTDEYPSYTYDALKERYYYQLDSEVINDNITVKKTQIGTHYSGISTTPLEDGLLSVELDSNNNYIYSDNIVESIVEYKTKYNFDNIIMTNFYNDMRENNINFYNNDYVDLTPLFYANQNTIYFTPFIVSQKDILEVEYYSIDILTKNITSNVTIPRKEYEYFEDIEIIEGAADIIETAEGIVIIKTTPLVVITYKSIIYYVNTISPSSTEIEGSFFNGESYEIYKLLGFSIPYYFKKDRHYYKIRKKNTYSSIVKIYDETFIANDNFIIIQKDGYNNGYFVIDDTIIALYVLEDYIYIFTELGSLYYLDPLDIKLYPDLMLIIENIPVPKSSIVNYFNSSFYYSDIEDNITKLELSKKYAVYIGDNYYSTDKEDVSSLNYLKYLNKLDKVYFRYYRMPNETNLQFYTRYRLNSQYYTNSSLTGLENAFSIFSHKLPQVSNNIFIVDPAWEIQQIKVGQNILTDSEYVVVDTTLFIYSDYEGDVSVKIKFNEQYYTYKLGHISIHTKHILLSYEPMVNNFEVMENIEDKGNLINILNEHYKNNEKIVFDKDVLIKDYVRFNPKLWEID